jgi:hypothetical protein
MASNDKFGGFDFDSESLAALTGLQNQVRKPVAAPTEQERLKEGALAALDALGAASVKDDSISFDGTRIQLPGQFEAICLRLLSSSWKFIRVRKRSTNSVAHSNSVRGMVLLHSSVLFIGYLELLV